MFGTLILMPVTIYRRQKQILEYLSKMINIKFELKEPEEYPSHFIDGRVAEIIIPADKNIKKSIIIKNLLPWARKNNEREIIGFVGEIHPKILKNWRIKMPIALFEIELEKILGRLK